MNNFLDQLNLTPQERRIVVAIGMVVIVVLNLVFLWPQFGGWWRITHQLQTMRGNIEKYNKEIALDTNPTNGLQKQLTKLVRQEGTAVMDFQNQLQDTIHSQARKTGVNVGNYYPGVARPDTNGFFEEESIRISFDSQEPQLISFLYNVGGDPAMIRVSELELSTQDQNRYRLKGNITLIANYAKRATPPAASGGKPAAKIPGTKPASGPGSAKPLPGAKPGQPSPIRPAQPGQRGLPLPGGPNAAPRTPFLPKNKTAG